MRPQDLPELRHAVINGWEVFTAQLNKEDYKHNPSIQYFLTPWKLGELFYVTDDMTQLAVAAARSMPEFEMRREDLPADHGIMYFDAPLGDDLDHPIHCCTWRPFRADDAYLVGKHEDGVMVDFHTQTRLLKPYVQLRPFETVALTYGGEVAALRDTGDAPKFWAHILRCAWLLMQQRVATIVEQSPDRAAMRRLARLGHAAEPVRVISLRQLEHHGGPGTDREYHHRWVVRGHWRNQWYASQERNVPIWISPYVKGPDGAPLLAGEKVYAWTR